MTEKVNPSPLRPAEAFKTAGAIAYGGHGGSGFIVDGSDYTELAQQDSDVDETSLNAFTATTSSSSLTVTIDPGEAFVFGAWVVKDTSTDVTLDASTSGQTVYVGWDKESPNDVIIGLGAAFDSGSGNTDQRLPLYEFDTDSSGVTASGDYRPLGQSLSVSEVSVLRSVDAGRVLRIDTDYGMIVSGDFTVNGVLDVDGTFTASGSINGDGTLRGNGTIRLVE